MSVFRHSRFLHPPLVAELFRPLAAMPYVAAKALWTAAALAGWLVSVHQAGALAGRAAPADTAASYSLGALFLPVYLAIERGQMDLLVLPLLLLAMQEGTRASRAGAALAV